MSENLFGGKNPNSLYAPMSDVEREVISRLVESGDLQVHIYIDQPALEYPKALAPAVRFGDHRLELVFRLEFTGSEAPTPIYYIDLELRTGSGILLFKERQSTLYGKSPIEVAGGVFMDLAWDIAISRIDPKIVKQIKPKAIGLTSRFTDKDTGNLTLFGNNDFNVHEQRVLRRLRAGEEESRRLTKERAAKAERAAATSTDGKQ